MALRFSTGVVNAIAYGMGWGDILKNSVIDVYSGSQPVTASTAATGTKLCRFTTSGGAFTSETRAAAKLVIAGGSGSIDTINVAGLPLLSTTVPYNTSVAQTMADVISNINANPRNMGFFAVTGGGTIGTVTYGAANAGEFYIVAPKNSGTYWNSLLLTTTSSTLTIAINTDASPSTSESGGFAAVSGDSVSGFTTGVACINGLVMTFPAIAGLISKSGIWSDASADATGTAGWFRILCTPNFDAGTTDLLTTGNSAYQVLRIDGSLGTSGADMTISNTNITAAATQTVNQFDLTIA